jgi:hypothetical protein
VTFPYGTIAIRYTEHNLRRFTEQTILGFTTLADFPRIIALLFPRQEESRKKETRAAESIEIAKAQVTSEICFLL